ncbi:MAG: trigger factor, partial [Spirosomaceae bacterium]|nr:trigger factor [Spirosomataceae bacterium]
LSGEYEYTVSKITRVQPAEIDQDLFDKALGKDKVSDEAGFREEIKSIIKDNYNRESSFMTNFAIEKMLDESIKIELPDEFLKDWLYKANEGKFTMEQIEKDYDAFARGLRLDLIRNEIAAIGDVKVEYPDVLEEAKNEIRNYFGGYGYDGMEDMIEQMANRTLKEDKDRSKFRDYFAKAFNGKILDYLRGVVKIETKSVSVEEFNQVAEALYGKQEPETVEA